MEQVHLRCSPVEDLFNQHIPSNRQSRVGTLASCVGQLLEDGAQAARRRKQAIQYFARSSSIRIRTEPHTDTAVVARSFKAPQMVDVKKSHSPNSSMNASPVEHITSSITASPVEPSPSPAIVPPVESPQCSDTASLVESVNSASNSPPFKLADASITVVPIETITASHQAKPAAAFPLLINVPTPPIPHTPSSQFDTIIIGHRVRADSAIAADAGEALVEADSDGLSWIQARLDQLFAGASVFDVERTHEGVVPRISTYEKRKNAWAPGYTAYGYESPPTSPIGSDAEDDDILSGCVSFRQFLELPPSQPRTASPLVDYPRRKLLHTCPTRLGLREIDEERLVARLVELAFFFESSGPRNDALTGQFEIEQLGEDLFSQLLAPDLGLTPAGTGSVTLKTQIKALQTVLSQADVWHDLSRAASQLKVGQMLWSEEVQGSERTALLLQLVLAAELFARFRLLQNSSPIQCEEIQAQQDDKVNWDLVMTERFLFRARAAKPLLVKDNNNFRAHRRSLLSTSSFVTAAEEQSEFRSRRPIPNARDVEERLEELREFKSQIQWPVVDCLEAQLNVLQHSSGADTVDEYDSCPADSRWMTQTLLASFNLPIDTTVQLLMGTLMENTPEASDLCKMTPDWTTGFTLSGRSFLSEKCIVGKVMAGSDTTQQTVDWVSTTSNNEVKPRWYDIESQEVSPLEKPRIKQAHALTKDSHPFGNAILKSLSLTDFSHPVDGPLVIGNEVLYQGISYEPSDFTLRKMKFAGDTPESEITGPSKANMAFSLPNKPTSRTTLSLDFNVHFISSHACHTHPSQSTTTETTNSHPLHMSHRYEILPAASLLSLPPTSLNQILWPPINADGTTSQETLVLDCRESNAEEDSRNLQLLARAWCSSQGQHALISSTKTTCLSCAVREARALGVRVVMRV